MSHLSRRAVRLAVPFILGFALPAAAVEVMIPRVGLEAGLGAAPAASIGAFLPGLSASFSAPALTALPAPSLSISAAPLAASPAFAAPAHAALAAAKAAQAAPSAPAGANLRGLTGAIAAAPGDAAAGALSQAFDNSDGKRADGLPLDWVDGMIAQSESADAGSRRLQDIVQRLGFSKAALNRDILQAHNDKYTVEIPMGTITDQKQSGRCWLFAGLNMIRSTMVADKTVPKEFEFSENYLHFFSVLERANRSFEEVSKKLYRRSSAKEFSSAKRQKAVVPALSDGGNYDWFAFLVAKYGLAPKSAMGETVSSEATAVLFSELNDSMAASTSELLANAKQYKVGREPNRAPEIQKRGMTRVWKILATHLGTPPASFDYRKDEKPKTEGRLQLTAATVKTYTPREFARDFVKFDPKDYVVLSSYPGKKENVAYEVKNSAIGKSAPGEPEFNFRFLNVSSDRLEELTAGAIRGGQPVMVSIGAKTDIDSETGIMHPRLYDRAAIYQFSPDEAAPELTRKQAAYFSRIGPNHAVVLTGYDQPDPSKPIVKFKMENSWGAKPGSKGIFHLYREWFHQNLFRIVVHKRFLNEKESDLWKGKGVILRDF